MVGEVFWRYFGGLGCVLGDLYEFWKKVENNLKGVYILV